MSATATSKGSLLFGRTRATTQPVATRTHTTQALRCRASGYRGATSKSIVASQVKKQMHVGNKTVQVCQKMPTLPGIPAAPTSRVQDNSWEQSSKDTPTLRCRHLSTLPTSDRTLRRTCQRDTACTQTRHRNCTSQEDTPHPTQTTCPSRHTRSLGKNRQAERH